MLCVTKGLEPVSSKILITDIDQCAYLRGRETAITAFFFFLRNNPEVTFVELESMACGLERNSSEHF